MTNCIFEKLITWESCNMTIGQWNLMSKITILNLLIVRFFWIKKNSGAVTQFTWQILKKFTFMFICCRWWIPVPWLQVNIYRLHYISLNTPSFCYRITATTKEKSCSSSPHFTVPSAPTSTTIRENWSSPGKVEIKKNYLWFGTN